MCNKEHSTGKEHADGGYGWVVVMSAFFICFITDGLVFSFGILLVELLDHFHTGRAATVTIASVMAGVMYLVGPLVGALCERFGCRVVVVTGAVISCVGFLISAYGTSIFYLCLSHGVLAGLGFGLMYIPAGVCVIQHFNRRRTLANGIAVCGSGGYVTLLPVVLADLFGVDIIAKSFGLLNFFIGVSGFISTPVGGFLFDITGKYDVTFVVAGAEFVISGLFLLLLKLFLKRRQRVNEQNFSLQL